MTISNWVRSQTIYVAFSALYFALTGPAHAAGLVETMLRQWPEVIPIKGSGGREYRLVVREINDRFSPRYRVQFVWMRIPMNDLHLQVREVGRFGSMNRLFEMFSVEDDVVATTGGFWAIDDRSNSNVPIGLVISKWITRNRQEDWHDGGVILQRFGKVEIMRIRDYRDSPFISEALQTKPMLVYDSKNDMTRDDGVHYNRIAVGMTAQRDLIVAALIGPTGHGGSLFEFAELLVSSVSRGGPAAHVALAMDGGPGAHLYFPSIQRHFGSSVNNYIANTLHICGRCKR